MPFTPPLTITSRLIDLISLISEALSRWEAEERAHSPTLRREHRIRTIQSSLAIKNNSLSSEQVTAIIKGKRVRRLPREIKEVQNAFAAYELLDSLTPPSRFSGKAGLGACHPPQPASVRARSHAARH